MAANLVAANADFVVCACNTAHAFEDYMLEGCGDVPFLSIIEVTATKVRDNILLRGLPKKCGILGGMGCVQSQIFQRSLTARNIEPVIPSANNQELLMDLIYRIKAGNKDEQVVRDFVSIL